MSKNNPGNNYFYFQLQKYFFELTNLQDFLVMVDIKKLKIIRKAFVHSWLIIKLKIIYSYVGLIKIFSY